MITIPDLLRQHAAELVPSEDVPAFIEGSPVDGRLVHVVVNGGTLKATFVPNGIEFGGTTSLVREPFRYDPDRQAFIVTVTEDAK